MALTLSLSVKCCHHNSTTATCNRSSRMATNHTSNRNDHSYPLQLLSSHPSHQNVLRATCFEPQVSPLLCCQATSHFYIDAGICPITGHCSPNVRASRPFHRNSLKWCGHTCPKAFLCGPSCVAVCSEQPCVLSNRIYSYLFIYLFCCTLFCFS